MLLPPILRGLVAILAAGAAFPLTGVMVLRLNLLPIRYTLMHGLAIVFLVLAMGRGKNLNLGISSSVLMVLAVAVASLLTSLSDVPSKDTLDMLWGSPFTIGKAELTAFLLLSACLFIYVVSFFRTISLIFFDRDVALSINRHIKLHEDVMVMLLALTVALSMRFVGALLIDALLIIPVICAYKVARSLKTLFIYSSLFGFLIAFLGYFASLYFDVPPSGAIAITSGVFYILIPKRKN